ncbi:unnamed protein product, partial [marine sediment metagenome]
QGTFRHIEEGKKPVIHNFDTIKSRIISAFETHRTPQIWNTGELADSLMGEHL